MVTPFGADRALDLDAAQRLATHLVEHGSDALVVSGTTGESPTTTDEEKADLLRVVLEAVGDRAKVVAGVGGFDTAHTVAAAKAAEARRARAAGGHALLQQAAAGGIRAHFTAVADATGLGVMLYDIPGRTGTKIATETLLQLAAHPDVGVKDAKGDFGRDHQGAGRDRPGYYCGADELNLAWLSIGAVGIVSVVAHVAGAEYRAMSTPSTPATWPRAREIDRRLVPAVGAIMTRTQGAIMAKAALKLPACSSTPPCAAAGGRDPRTGGRLTTDLRSAGLLR